MTEHEQGTADGELVATVSIDPLRSAFASALRVVVEALPPSRARDVAIEQIMEAHVRAEAVLARSRILN